MADKYNLGAVQQGITKTLLYDGVLDSTGSYNLNDNVYNYKLIIVEHESISDSIVYKQAQPICTIGTNVNEFHLCCHGNGPINSYISYCFSDDGKKIIINTVITEKITKIYGFN